MSPALRGYQAGLSDVPCFPTITLLDPVFKWNTVLFCMLYTRLSHTVATYPYDYLH